VNWRILPRTHALRSGTPPVHGADAFAPVRWRIYCHQLSLRLPEYV
jgi:hypothetical protein